MVSNTHSTNVFFAYLLCCLGPFSKSPCTGTPFFSFPFSQFAFSHPYEGLNIG